MRFYVSFGGGQLHPHHPQSENHPIENVFQQVGMQYIKPFWVSVNHYGYCSYPQYVHSIEQQQANRYIPTLMPSPAFHNRGSEQQQTHEYKLLFHRCTTPPYPSAIPVGVGQFYVVFQPQLSLKQMSRIVSPIRRMLRQT
jgi:hypothetical protein